MSAPLREIRCSADQCCSSCEADVLRALPDPKVHSMYLDHDSLERIITIDASPEAVAALVAFHRHEVPLAHRHEAVWALRCEDARQAAEEARAEYERVCADARAWLDAHP